jgi:hypothetical protein
LFLPKRPDQGYEFISALGVMFGVRLQVFGADGRFEDHTGWKPDLIRSAVPWFRPSWHFDL